MCGLYGHGQADGGDAEGCRPWLASWTGERDLSVVPVSPIPAQWLAVLAAVVHETVPACCCDRSWSAIVESCARVGSHGADECLPLVGSVPDLPSLADADQEWRDERGRAADSAPGIGSGAGFPLPVPAADAQRAARLVGGDQAVGCSAATGAQVARVGLRGQWFVIVLLDARPERQTNGATAAFEVWVVDRSVEVALFADLAARLYAEGAPARAGHEKDAGHEVGEPFRSADALQCFG